MLTIGLNRAVTLLGEAGSRGRGKAKTLGKHPADGKAVTLRSGRYGPYLSHGRTRASVPKELPPDEVTLEQAVEILDAKAAAGGEGKARGKRKPKGKAKKGGSKPKAKPETDEDAAAAPGRRAAGGSQPS